MYRALKRWFSFQSAAGENFLNQGCCSAIHRRNWVGTWINLSSLKEVCTLPLCFALVWIRSPTLIKISNSPLSLALSGGQDRAGKPTPEARARSVSEEVYRSRAICEKHRKRRSEFFSGKLLQGLVLFFSYYFSLSAWTVNKYERNLKKARRMTESAA